MTTTNILVVTASLGCLAGLIDVSEYVTQRNNLSRSEAYLATVSGGLLGIITSPLYIPYKAYKIIKKLST